MAAALGVGSKRAVATAATRQHANMSAAPRCNISAAVAGDYARALQNGVEVVPLLVETFGGFGPGLVDTLRKAAEWRQNRLVASEYDEATWATRTFQPFVCQRISVAVQLAMAQQIAEALRMSTAADPRPAP